MSSIGDESNSEESDEGRAERTESIVESKHQPYPAASEDTLEDSDVSDGTNRPGRYQGSDYNWTYLVQDSTSVANALSCAENDDLSLHLYNTHAWKLLHRHHQPNPIIQPWHSKHRWIQHAADGTSPFLPPPKWTAWPLRPDDVPRSQEQWGRVAVSTEEDIDTFSKPEPWKPSLHLQEELIATLLRQAKEAFSRRKWQHSDVTASSESSLLHKGTENESHHTISIRAEDSDDVDDLERLDEISQGANVQSLSLPRGEDWEAVFMDDDDRACEILQPIVRHILVKVDHILIALHKNRQGHRTAISQSRKRNKSRRRSESRSKTKSSTLATKRKRLASGAVEAEIELQEKAAFEGESPEGVETPKYRPSRAEAGQHSLGLRDWSEVLGLAAMTGWNQSAIDRTAERCAAIFEERMTMRTMPETIDGQARDRLIQYRPVATPSTHELPEEHAGGHVVQSAIQNVSNYPCPFLDCVKHNIPFEKFWRLREHLERKHKQTSEDIKMLEMPVSRGDQDGKPAPGHSCPYKTCPRHSKPFEKRWRLSEHLKRKHKGQQSPDSYHESKITNSAPVCYPIDDTTADCGGDIFQHSFLQPIVLEIGESKDLKLGQGPGLPTGSTKRPKRDKKKRECKHHGFKEVAEARSEEN